MVVPETSAREETVQLIAEKDRIEKKISEYGQILEANGNVGMTGSLVVDGFPRNDIDVHQVRHARHEIICLQNDLKELMERIKKGLEDIHEKAASEQSTSKGAAAKSAQTENEYTEPIVVVNLVTPGSPAEDAGLKVGDGIVEFGSVNSQNFKNLNTIGNVVQHRENQQIPLKVRREGKFLQMKLIPRIWNGRGLLGCNIVLPESVEH